jgi:tRNA nucleotidyltransferase (CCA-adding enzyme)
MFKDFQEQIPEAVKSISRSLTEARFENFLVGGCVRDILLERTPKDWDITTQATPEEIQKLFPDSFYENEFGTVGVKTDTVGIVEVTPYRLESEYTDSRHPEKVEWGKSVEEDLARRDFTINAIALSLELADENYKIIDPYQGKEDLKKKLIRTVGKPDDRFQEDALRILRALRLSSELNFAIEAETLSSIEKNGDLLEKISQERIQERIRD